MAPRPARGAIVAALEYATGRRARTVGKPETADVRDRARSPRAPAARSSIGDRLDADLAGAAAAGLDGAIVLTGVTDAAAAEAAVDPTPVAIGRDLATLVLGA